MSNANGDTVVTMDTARPAQEVNREEERLKVVHYKLIREGRLIVRGQCTDAAHALLRSFTSELDREEERVVRGVVRTLSEMPFERKLILLLATRLMESQGMLPKSGTIKHRRKLAILSAIYILKSPRMVRNFVVKDGRVHFDTTRVEMRSEHTQPTDRR